MTEPFPIRILLVDNDTKSRKANSAFFSRYPSFEVFEGENGRDGLKVALEMRPDIIISDYDLPILNGIELCQKIKSVPMLSSAVFLLLTGEKEMEEQQVNAFEHGIDDCISKTTPPVILTGKIKVYLRLKQLQKELEVEKQRIADTNIVLERNFRELTSILLKIVDIKVLGAADRAEIARQLAEHACSKLDLPEDVKKKIVFGAQLHEIGKIGLPDGFADKHPSAMSPDDRTIYNQYPIIGSRIISTIAGYEDSSEALYHQLENYDGSGPPDGLMGEEIPVGARVLRSIVLQEDLSRAGVVKEEIIQEVRCSASKTLHPVMATSLAEFIIESDKEFLQNKRKIHIEELKAGMVIAEDVYAVSGVKLLPKGMKIQDHILTVLMERNSRDPIIGGVYIVK